MVAVKLAWTATVPSIHGVRRLAKAKISQESALIDEGKDGVRRLAKAKISQESALIDEGKDGVRRLAKAKISQDIN